MIAILSPRRSASSIKCVVRRTTRPSFFWRNRSHIARLEYGSMPEVGSSSITNFGDPMNAIATHSFLFMPPESEELNVSIFSSRPTSRTRALTKVEILSFGIPLIKANITRCSRTVIQGKRIFC
mmetsp:Transcript_6251/g.8287  ORF Transcript_6251/g.8287 Transcript_6251/m.8287 type:complete len:124 (-) Transcript_6251:15-386(-)